MADYEETPDGKTRYIITFKRKDQRKDKDDKTDLLQRSVSPHLEFVDVSRIPLGFNLRDDPKGLLALDVNDFTLPTVFAALDEAEADELSKDKDNIASVELDGKTYAQEFAFSEIPPEGGLIEALGEAQVPGATGGPSAQADAVPWGISRIKAPWCWDATKGKGIYVAVMDTGIWPHNDLKGNLLGGISFVPGQSWVDGNSHGTHCAGTIAARLNGFGVVGVAPSAYLYAVKVLSDGGSGQWSWLMQGLYWMRKYHGCAFDVANISLGGAQAPSALKSYVNYAAKRTLLACAAGNNGNGVIYPAKFSKALAVSAIDSANNIPSWSSRGPEVELCAPGVNVYSTLPGNSYGYKSGTSMATPHVSGAAALCRATHRHMDVDRVWKLLTDNADDLGNPGKDTKYGHGRVDGYGATFSKSCG